MIGYGNIFYLLLFFLGHHPNNTPAAVPLVQRLSLPFQSSDSLVKCFQIKGHPSLPLQAAGEGVDCGAFAGNMPPLLRPCGYANLCRQLGGKVQLEQERVWNGAEQLLLGLLLHPSVRGLRQRQVRNKRATVAPTLCYSHRLNERRVYPQGWRREGPPAGCHSLGLTDGLHPHPGPHLLPAHLLNDPFPLPHGLVARWDFWHDGAQVKEVGLSGNDRSGGWQVSPLDNIAQAQMANSGL